MKALSNFFSFASYQSREDYKAKTGKEAPPWNPEKPIKTWADENPTNSEFDELLGEIVTYRPVLAVLPNGRLREGADGQPVTGWMRLTVDDAKAYNFLPAQGVVPVTGESINGIIITARHVANAQRSIPVPLNLPEGSRIVFAPGIGLEPVVLLKGETLPQAGGGGFTTEDRELLRRIAAKVGA